MKANKFKYAGFGLLLLLVISNSCNQAALDDVKPLTPTEEEYFTEENHFERAILATYAKMNAIYSWNGGEYCNCPNMGLWQLPGDDMTSSGGGENVDFETFTSLQASNGVIGRYYKALYEAIGRAHVLLQKNTEVADGIYVTADLKNNHRGEALFLRSYAYFTLWNYFSTAPLVTERVTDANNVFVSPSTGTQLLDQAIIDLQEAVTLLPVSWNANNRGRVTKNAANGLLGKALVFRGMANSNNADYTAAIAAFDAISGVSLVAKFDDNFAANTENNAESLFEYQASQSTGENIWLPDEFDNTIGSMSTSAWVPFEGINNWGYGGVPFKATQKLINAFEPADPRLPLTIDMTNAGVDRIIKKYITRDQKIPAYGSSVNNPRILRYADVILLKAEAILLSGGSKASAIGLINQVRTRARNMVPAGTVPADLNTGETNDATIMQMIMDERFRELAFEEGNRWLDLRRWHKAGKITLNTAFFNSTNPNFSITLPKHLNLPIPLNELDANANMQQNEGY